MNIALVDTINERYDQLLDTTQLLTGVFILLMTAIITTDIVLRYFGQAISWSGHAAQALIIWVTFLTIGLHAREDDHIKIRYFYNQFPAWYQRINVKIELFVKVSFAILATLSAFVVTMRTFGGSTAQGVPVVFVYGPVFLGMIMLSIVYVREAIGDLTGGDIVEERR